jgi:hypothetical protein
MTLIAGTISPLAFPHIPVEVIGIIQYGSVSTIQSLEIPLNPP